ncbi:MAG: hypothetical protein IPK82_17260 [Polyangiaceae bacterium]|nr:hypothetical protein [Polyangiaceae bacterium]
MGKTDSARRAEVTSDPGGGVAGAEPPPPEKEVMDGMCTLDVMRTSWAGCVRV